MKSTTQLKVLRDDIDMFVEDILADPARAGELKRKLRARLRSVAPPTRSAIDDGDDLWNNVPV